MISIAMEDLQHCLSELPQAEMELLNVISSEQIDSRNAILEIRPGTGGTEAQIFALDLFRLYQKYAESKNWKFEILSFNVGNDPNGVREAIAMIQGEGFRSPICLCGVT